MSSPEFSSTPFPPLWRAGLVSLFCLLPSAAPAQLGSAGAQLFEPGQAGLPGDPLAGEFFGRALAGGDFNGDRYADLAIGTPNDSVAGQEFGSVTVIQSDSFGLDSFTAVVWSLSGIAGQGPGTDEFGYSLAAGDFNGDGYADLAMGAPRRGGGGSNDVGGVLVVYGSAAGLAEPGADYWSQGENQVNGVPEEGDWFGQSLAAGDFDGDGYDDLAVGVSGEDVGGVADAGAVNILNGSVVGLSTVLPRLDTIWSEDDLPNSIAQEGDRFGEALIAGDWNGDGYDDLAIGAPGKDWPPSQQVGAVFVMKGSTTGLTATGAQQRYQQHGGIPDESEDGDQFGASLASGDVDGDRLDDLLIGSPGEDVDFEGVEVSNAGMVHVLPGVQGYGVSTNASAAIDRPQLAGVAGSGELFGRALAAGEFDGGGRAEAVIGVPGAAILGETAAGVAYVLGGADLDAPDVIQGWSQAGTMPGVPEAYDWFGQTLLVADFDGNGFDDLAIGVPYEDHGDETGSGVVNVVYSMGLFRDGFESGATDRWSSAPE